MTTKDLLKKFQTKKTGLSSEQTVNVLAQILKRLNPERKNINDKMHFFLKEWTGYCSGYSWLWASCGSPLVAGNWNHGIGIWPSGEREKPMLCFHLEVLWKLRVVDVGEEFGITCYGVWKMPFFWMRCRDVWERELTDTAIFGNKPGHILHSVPCIYFFLEDLEITTCVLAHFTHCSHTEPGWYVMKITTYCLLRISPHKEASGW